MPDMVLEIAESGRHVCVQRGCVAIMEGETCLGRVPVDSLAAVILSAEGVSLSRHLLARMAEEGVPVIVCGANYLPISMSLPLAGHYRALPVVEAQMAATPALKRRLWQGCVAAKIRNQAAVLRQCRPRSLAADSLLALSRKVRTGDSDNKEARAARLYWPALMGQGFVRDPDGGGINAALNYGYAIIRAACARALCAAGLLPLLGIFHHNVYNAFCLADDMMEPLRPFMDRLVLDMLPQMSADALLTPARKRQLAGILRMPLPFGGEGHVLSSIATQMAQGLARSFAEGRPCLPFPGL